MSDARARQRVQASLRLRDGRASHAQLHGQHGRVEASALAVGSYVWQATNSGENMTLAYIG